MVTEKKKPTKNLQESKQEIKDQEAQKASDEKKHREYIESKLKEWDFKEEDDLRYSFTFSNSRFTLRIANQMERTKIKALMAQIAFIPGLGIISSTDEIMGSGDMDLMCSAILTTRVPLLVEKIPDGFDIEKLGESGRFIFGYAILICEQEFIDRKKKVS